MSRVAGRTFAAGFALALLAWAPAAAEPIETEGIVRSEARVEIKSKAAAPVRRIAVREGQIVQAGTLMVELVNDVERAQLEASTAEVERARSALADAELRKKTADRELERNLTVEDLITERELELSRDAADQAGTVFAMRQRELTKAEAHLNLAEAVYQGTFIKAPFDGQVARIYTTVGEMPRPTETVLLDLISLDKLYVEIALPLEHLKRIREGMPVSVVVEEGNPANEARLEGRVRFIYPEIDPTIRMVRVKVAIDRRGLRILPGMFAKARLDLAPAPGS